MSNVSRNYREIASENASESIFIVDPEGQVVYADDRLNDLLKLDPTDILNRSFWFLFRKLGELSTDPQLVESQLAVAHRALIQQPTVYLHARHSPGSRLQVRLRVANAWEGWLGILRDVTDEWRGFAKQSEYLSIILRALRSSQASIKGLVDTLISSHRYWQDEQRHEFLQDIDRNVSKLSQVLDYGQQTLNLYTGSIKLNRRRVSPKPLMQQVLRSMLIKQSNRQLDIDLPDDMPDLTVDTMRFSQLFQYLLSNAIASSPPQSKIKVSAHSTADDGELIISITDQGAGLSNIQLVQMLDIPAGPSLWNRDDLLEANLGLYIARELARAHGGQIWAESAHGAGTTVHCALPVSENTNGVDVPAPAVTENRQIEQLPSANGHVRTNYRVLITEDDLEMVKLMRMVLERSGFQVVHAANGSAALDMATEWRPDVILMDMYLPDGNGIDIAMQIRQITNVPIIMASINQRPEDRTRALNLGIDDFLVKPLDWAELVARVRARLRMSPAAGRGQSTTTYEFGDLIIDFRQRRVEMDEQALHLSPKEYDFIALLASNAGQVLTHDYILEKVWGSQYRGEKRHLWVVSSRVRKKLGDDKDEPRYIRTDPGVGYFMPEPDSNGGGKSFA